MTVLVAGMLAVLTSAHAADLYVSLEGSDDNSGSKGKPFASLAAARDAARQYVGTEAVTTEELYEDLINNRSEPTTDVAL